MSYTFLSTAYDALMSHVDYEKWADYIKTNIEQYKPDTKLVLDLACGTGTLTNMLEYEMIGIDGSIEMLDEARKKAKTQEKEILFLNQDMREFELYGTVDVILCTCDGLNYILEEDELSEVFRLVENYLDPHGLFIFDINTPYKYEEILGENSFSQTEETHALIWDNYFDEEEQINEYAISIFSRGADGRYDKSEEFHYQRAYSIEAIKNLLQKNHLELIKITDDYTQNEPSPTSQRLTFMAKEMGRKTKETAH